MKRIVVFDVDNTVYRANPTTLESKLKTLISLFARKYGIDLSKYDHKIPFSRFLLYTYGEGYMKLYFRKVWRYIALLVHRVVKITDYEREMSRILNKFYNNIAYWSCSPTIWIKAVLEYLGVKYRENMLFGCDNMFYPKEHPLSFKELKERLKREGYQIVAVVGDSCLDFRYIDNDILKICINCTCNEPLHDVIVSSPRSLERIISVLI